MAFNRPLTRNNNGNESANDNWRAQGFLNLYIPTPDGGRRKLGSIPLRESKAFEKAIIERLKEEGALESLAQNIELDFQLADKEVKTSDLGF